MTMDTTSSNGNGGTPSQNDEFGVGQAGGRSPTTPTLDPALHSSVLTEEVNDPTKPYTAQGVLQPLQRFSGVGMSAQDNARKFVGDQHQVPQPSFNGASTDQQEKYTALRINGSESSS